MMIDKIISLANQKVRLQFLAMERSLRATGCQLPILVIPYDDHLFELPEGSTWWEIPEITNWLKAEKTHPVMRKYQSLTASNYQFVDTDICFLRNPEKVLQPFSGFITSCGHWRNTEHTCTSESQQWISKRSTVWQTDAFNTGQYASNRALYTVEELKSVAMHPDFVGTCIRWKHNEQPGLDLLVWNSGVEISNLTLPPVRMESTWAGDYPAEYECYWQDPQRKPYLIHWAGEKPGYSNRPINQIFYNFLTTAERNEWEEEVKNLKLKKNQNYQPLRTVVHRVKQAFQALA
jgi:hypothetical protein